MKRLIQLLLLLMPGILLANSTIQTTPIKITPTLIKQLKKIHPDSSNAHEVEQLIGKPTACLPLPPSKEAWICQWKGDLASSRIENTLNIMFSAGMITNMVAIDQQGNELHKNN